MSSTNMSPTATGTCICFSGANVRTNFDSTKQYGEKKFLVKFLAKTWWFQT